MQTGSSPRPGRQSPTPEPPGRQGLTSIGPRADPCRPGEPGVAHRVPDRGDDLAPRRQYARDLSGGVMPSGSSGVKWSAMPDAEEPIADDLAAGAVELVPFLGPILAPFAKRGSRKIREEWARNASKALRAAERISEMSREELSHRIIEDPRIIPLFIRVLYTAGMTGQDPILAALGVALGGAIRDPDKVDEAELLLIGMANLRGHHILILRIMTVNRPHPTEPDTFVYWLPENLANESGYSRNLVDICVAGLMGSGLIQLGQDAYGVCYEISDLGRTALKVIDELDEAQDKASSTKA
jgi:hypothetical protein